MGLAVWGEIRFCCVWATACTSFFCINLDMVSISLDKGIDCDTLVGIIAGLYFQ
jgi:hypothetical protein